MEKIIEKLFRASKEGKIKTCDEARILKSTERNKILLKKRLSKNQRRLLLRIIDAKDLFAETIAINSFTDGFKLG